MECFNEFSSQPVTCVSTSRERSYEESRQGSLKKTACEIYMLKKLLEQCFRRAAYRLSPLVLFH